jgi:hypothetical protein
MPWNGVCALTEQGSLTPQSLQVIELYRLQKKYPNCKPCFMRGVAAPFYYDVTAASKA